MILFALYACSSPDHALSPRQLAPLGPTRPPDADRPDAPTPLGDADAHADPSFLFDGATTDLALHVEQSAIAALEADGDAEVPATLVYDGAAWTVGLKRKGNMTRRGFAGKPSLKVDVGAFVQGQRFHGLRRLTLNNMVQDASMLREHVAYHLYRELGVPAPRHGYVRLVVNDEPYGLYGLVESMDQDFLDRWWPDDDEGNLYEGGYGGDLIPGRDDDFSLQEEGVPLAPADLLALIEALDATTPATVTPTLERRFALDEVLDALAVDLLAGSWDGYARAANNYLLYHAPVADRWHLVPWGQDQAFSDRYVPLHAGWEGRILTLCGRAPACVDRLWARVHVALGAWDGALAHARATAAAIAADCEADPRAELSCDPDDTLAFLVERPGIVAPELSDR